MVLSGAEVITKLPPQLVLFVYFLFYLFLQQTSPKAVQFLRKCCLCGNKSSQLNLDLKICSELSKSSLISNYTV